jgi:hypothetical protein
LYQNMYDNVLQHEHGVMNHLLSCIPIQHDFCSSRLQNLASLIFANASVLVVWFVHARVIYILFLYASFKNFVLVLCLWFLRLLSEYHISKKRWLLKIVMLSMPLNCLSYQNKLWEVCHSFVWLIMGHRSCLRCDSYICVFEKGHMNKQYILFSEIGDTALGRRVDHEQ